MRKRLPAVLSVALALTRCNGTSPTAPSTLVSRAAGRTSGAETVLVSGFPTWQIGGATGDFRVHPTQGAAPLEVHVNMCHSTDPSPGISLHYKVVWDDGSDDHGFCRFDHVYEKPGQFQAVACVWDEIPAHAPGSCLKITFNVTPHGFCHSITATNGGNPASPAACPTGATEFCDFGPIVATSSGQAEEACVTCFGKCVNSTTLGIGFWGDAASTTFFQYGPPTTPGMFGCPHSCPPGSIAPNVGCSIGRWAP